MSACICVVSSPLMQEDCVIMEPTVVMGLCFCEGTLAREVGSGTEREHEVCFVFVAFKLFYC